MDYSNDETLEKIKNILPFDEFKSNADLIGKVQIIVNENHRLEDIEDRMEEKKLNKKESILDKFENILDKIEKKVNKIGEIITDFEYETRRDVLNKEKEKYKEDKEDAENCLIEIENEKDYIWKLRKEKMDFFD